MREVEEEGIAVDLENAIQAFQIQINTNATMSSRLFAQDLQNKSLRYLDIGCGIGRYMLILKNNGIKNVFGFDIVYRLVEIGNREYGLKNILAASAKRIPLPKGSVDRVLMYNVIEHCSEPEKVLSEVHRILTPDGFLYMDVPNARSMGDRLFRWGGKIVYGKTSHIQKFTWGRIERIVAMTNFQVMQYKTQRGIFLDYPQLNGFTVLKKILGLLFGEEIAAWELKLGKKQ